MSFYERNGSVEHTADRESGFKCKRSTQQTDRERNSGRGGRSSTAGFGGAHGGGRQHEQTQRSPALQHAGRSRFFNLKGPRSCSAVGGSVTAAISR